MMQGTRGGRATRGFTLVELMVAMAIAVILLAGVYQFFIAQQRSYSSQDELNRVQQNARVAETLISKAIQLTGSYLPDTLNAATISMRDQSILAATDRYIVLQYDDPQNTANQHVVAADEMVAFVVSKTVPTAGTTGGTEAIDLSVYFDKNGDGTLTDADAHSFQIALNLAGPPYTLYRVTPSATGGITAEAITTNVDNFVLRYFGRDGQPVVLDAAGQQALANTGLTATQRTEVRSVEVELVLRTANEDPNLPVSAWTDFAAGSVVTRDASGDIDSSFTGFNDRYRRRKFATRITPRSLAIGSCGRLELAASDPAPNCPDGTTITATVLDQYGQPVNGAFVAITATDGTLSAPGTTTGTVAPGQGSVDLDYDGISKPVMIAAQTNVTCTDKGVTGAVTLHNSFVVNFQPGPWDYVELTPPSDLDHDTGTVSGTAVDCGFSFDFSTKVYDQCENLVTPDAGMEFTATLPGGTQATVTGGGTLTADQQTFTVTEPTAAGPWGSAIADFTLTVAAAGTMPLGVSNGGEPVKPDASFNVTLNPWPPVSLQWDTVTPLPSTGYDDCPAGAQPGYFFAQDCFANPVFDPVTTSATVTHDAPAGPQEVGDQGTLFSDPSVPQTSAAETISITTPSSGTLYEVSYLPPTCTLDPTATPAGITPTVTLTGPATVEDSLTQPLTVEPCMDSCSMVVTAQPAGSSAATGALTLSECDVPATVLVTVTRCNLDQKQVQLSLEISGASATAHLEDPVSGASGDPISVAFTFAAGSSTAEAYLVIEDAADGADITVKAEYLDASGQPYWTCDTVTVSVNNLCSQLDIYTDAGYSQSLLQGANDCLSGISDLYFEVDDCRFTSSRVSASAPNSGLWVSTYVNGIEWDREPVDLDPYNIDPYGTGASNAAKLRSVNPLPIYQDNFAVYDDGQLTYPSWGSIQVNAKYIDPNDSSDTGCEETVGLTAPLPICFPNAITSGGGAGWNGNFKVHWGDVVVRGNIAVPSKFIEKSTTGQFNGSGFTGTGYSDRFVDVYAGKSFPGDTATGNYVGEANPDPGTLDQPYLGSGYGNYFRNITYAKITEMIVVIDYDTLKSLAEDAGTYWYTLPSGDVINPETGQQADLQTVLSLPGPGLENAYHNGDFIFIDTYGTATTPPNTAGWEIDAAATTDLPNFKISGNFFTEGIIYVAGNVEFGGLGSTTTIAATTPPEYERHYDHNTPGWLTDESQLPIRSDASLSQQSFNIGVHINGAVYTDGELSGSGNPSVYGSLTTERGYQGSGTPEIWYNYNLNVSGVNESLCVACCNLTVSPSFTSLVKGDTVTLNGIDPSGTVEWTIAGNWPDVAGQTVATIGAATGVLTAQETGWVQVRARDSNNCVAYATVWVTTPCDVFTTWTNADPNWAQLDIGDSQRFTIDYTPSGAGSVSWGIASWSDQSAQFIGTGVAAGKDYADVLATCGGTWTVFEATDPACSWPLQMWVNVNCPSSCNLTFAAAPTTVPTGGSYTLVANTDVCRVDWQLFEGGVLIGSAWPGSTISGSYASVTVDTATPLQATVSGLADTPMGTQVSVQANSWCDASCTDTATFDVASCSAITVTQNTAGSPLQVGNTYGFTAAGGNEDYIWRVGGTSVGTGSFSVSPAPDTELADFTPIDGGTVTVEVEDAMGCTGATDVEVCGLALDTAAATVQVGGATATINASGAVGAVNWSWSTPDTADLSLSTATGASTEVTGLTNGTATLTATDAGVAGCSADVAVTVDPAAAAWVELLYDDFEGGWGNYSDGGSDASLHPTNGQGGSQAADIQDNSSSSYFALTSSLPLVTSGYTELKVEFWYKGVSMEANEDFWLQFSSNGGSSWTTVATWASGVEFNNGDEMTASVTITDGGSTPFSDNVKIRFVCDASGNSDDVYIDEVRISAK